MFGFLKKIFGLPTDEEISAAKSRLEPVVNNKTGDIVDSAGTTVTVNAAVNSQITDAVTQEVPVKKPRKPRTPKADKVSKSTTKKVVAKRSKKA